MPGQRREIRTPDAPAPTAGAPYRQAIVFDRLVFVSGQLPLDPATGTVVPGDVAAQTRQVLRNLAAILAAAGSGLDRLLKVTVYLRDRADWPAMNVAYAEAVGAQAPARTAVVVGEMSFGALVEIDAIAAVYD